MPFERYSADFLANPDDYVEIYRQVLPGVSREEARHALRLYAEIADLQKCIDAKYAELHRTAHKSLYSKHRYMDYLRAVGAHDMTLKDAARSLGNADDTANQHIALARDRMCCKTTTGAVYVAVKEGLI